MSFWTILDALHNTKPEILMMYNVITSRFLPKTNSNSSTLKLSFIYLFLLLPSLFISIYSVNAQNRRSSKSPYRSKISGRIGNLLPIFERYAKPFKFSEEKLVDSINGLNLNLRVQGVGNLKIKFNSVKAPNWEATVSSNQGTLSSDPLKLLILKGTLNSRKIKNTVKIIAIITEDAKGKKVFSIHVPAIPGIGRKAYEFSTVLKKRNKVLSAKVKGVPALKSEFQAPNCEDHFHNDEEASSDALKQSSSSSVDGIAKNATVTRILELATDADFAFFQNHGQRANAVIAAAVEFGSDILVEDFGIEIKIVRQNVFRDQASNPYDNLDSVQYLNEFARYALTNRHLGNADLYHLFSGLNFNGSTIGRAFIGGACNSNIAYGFTQDLSRMPQMFGGTFVHEVGHNLGSRHDPVERGFVMEPTIYNPPNTKFSDFSKDAINNFLGGVSCLEEVGSQRPTPTRVPTTIPTNTRTPRPIPSPTNTRIVRPTAIPTAQPTATSVPTVVPSPTFRPTFVPTVAPIPSPKPTVGNPEDRDLVASSIRRYRFSVKASRSGSVRVRLSTRFNEDPTNDCNVDFFSSIDEEAFTSVISSGKSFSHSISSRPKVSLDETMNIMARVICGNNDEIVLMAVRTIPMVGRIRRGEQSNFPKTRIGWNNSFREGISVRSRRRLSRSVRARRRR